MTERSTYWPPPTSQPKPRRRWLVPALVALVVAPVGTLAAVLLWPEPTAETPVEVAQTDREPAPVVEPSGSRGEEWHMLHRDEPWAARVLGVDAIGQWLLIGTDLGTGEEDLAVAVEICRTGREHVAGLGVPNAQVTVYGPPGNLTLAESDGGQPCAVAL